MQPSACATFLIATILSMHASACSRNLVPPIGVEVEHVARLGATDGPGQIFDEAHRVSRLDDGRYTLAEVGDLGVIKVYDANGRYLQRVGRKGSGPGEYTAPVYEHMTSNRDSIFVIDPWQARLTVLNARMTEVADVRRFPFTNVPTLIFYDDSTIVVNALQQAGVSKEGNVIHVVSTSGKIENSFGPIPAGVRGPETESAGWRLALAKGEDQTIWSAARDEFVVRRWSMSGELLTEISPADEELKIGSFHYPKSPNDSPPSRQIVGLWQSDGDILCVVTREPSPQWKDVFEQAVDDRGVTRYRVKGPSVSVYRTRIEIFNLATGEHVSSTVFDHPAEEMLGGGFFYSHEEDASGIPFTDVWRLRVRHQLTGTAS